MNLTRALVSIDVEGTGIDPSTEAIFEFSAVLFQPDGTRKTWTQGFKPWKPIPPEVEELCGRKNAEFDNCPLFSEWAERIARALQGKDFLGFNLRRYDLPIIDQELRRSGFCLDMTGVAVIDAYGIFSKKHPRKLEDAVRIYCGREHVGAHGAAADAEATLEVFLGMISKHEDLAADLSAEDFDALSRMSENAPVDLAGKLYRDAEGIVRFNFGKNKGRAVNQEHGYCRWILEKAEGFPGSTLDAIREELERS